MHFDTESGVSLCATPDSTFFGLSCIIPVVMFLGSTVFEWIASEPDRGVQIY